MAWRDLKAWLFKARRHLSSEFAFRTTLRVVPVFSDQIHWSRTSKQIDSPLLILILRGLITSRAGIDQASPEILKSASDANQMLVPYVSTYDYLPRAVRSTLQSVLDPRNSMELTRQAIQASADGLKNVTRSRSMHKEDTYYAVDLWREIRRDMESIGSGTDAKSLRSNVLDDEFANSIAWCIQSQEIHRYGRGSYPRRAIRTRKMGAN